MSSYLNQSRTTSTAVNLSGVWAGNVTRIDTELNRVWVEIPRLTPGYQYGPLPFAGLQLPSLGDRVLCEFLEGKTSDLVVVAVVKTPSSPRYTTPITCTSDTRPTNAATGTIIFEEDTFDTYVWTGSTWSVLQGGGAVESFYDGGIVSGSYDVDLSVAGFHAIEIAGETSIDVTNVAAAGSLARFSLQVTMGESFYPVLWPESFQWAFDIGPLAPDVEKILTFRAYSIDGGTNWRISIPDFA
jgi:hypothetical protein